MFPLLLSRCLLRHLPSRHNLLTASQNQDTMLMSHTVHFWHQPLGMWILLLQSVSHMFILNYFINLALFKLMKYLIKFCLKHCILPLFRLWTVVLKYKVQWEIVLLIKSFQSSLNNTSSLKNIKNVFICITQMSSCLSL